MELGEKIAQLRKHKGLTQEELAQALFVSRTAISKWEQNRGYPSIESLKQLSDFFEVSIDELLSNENLLLLCEKDKQNEMFHLFHFLIAMMDISSILLILLPLYPKTLDKMIINVNLFDYIEISMFYKGIYWCLFLMMVILGILKLLLVKFKQEHVNQFLTKLSFVFSIITIFILGISKVVYAMILAFTLFLIKIAILMKQYQKM